MKLKIQEAAGCESTQHTLVKSADGKRWGHFSQRADGSLKWPGGPCIYSTPVYKGGDLTKAEIAFYKEDNTTQIA